MHIKNCFGRQGLAQKASQISGNTSVQWSIVESINKCSLDFQWLAKGAYFSILLLIILATVTCNQVHYYYSRLTFYRDI